MDQREVQEDGARQETADKGGGSSSQEDEEGPFRQFWTRQRRPGEGKRQRWFGLDRCPCRRFTLLWPLLTFSDEKEETCS